VVVAVEAAGVSPTPVEFRVEAEEEEVVPDMCRIICWMYRMALCSR
jgi:hypothetical protein